MKRMKVEKWRGGAALLLAALLSLPVSAGNPTTAYAMAVRRTVNLNIEGFLKRPELPADIASSWEGDKVVFGEYEGSPILFRVLDPRTTDFGGTTMLLDCDSILYDRAFNEYTIASPCNVWRDSRLRDELNGSFLDSFTDGEKAAIHESRNPSSHESWEETWESLNYGKLSSGGDKIFVLDASEVEHEAYGYSHTDYPAVNREKIGGANSFYWLRSPEKDFTYMAGGVHSDGEFDVYTVDFTQTGVSPALNLHLSSVLFSTERGADKSAFSDTAEAVASHGEWVLTLKNGETGFAATRTDPAEIITAAAGGDVALSLSGAFAGANQISGMLLDGNQTVLRYGKIAETADSAATVTIPAGLTDGAKYTLWVFPEEAHADKTSYAGAPVELHFTVGMHTVHFDLNGHGGAAIPDAAVADGAVVPKPTDPAESGWTFGGWYREADCVNAFNFFTPITGDITLYARWTKTENGGGSGGSSGGSSSAVGRSASKSAGGQNGSWKQDVRGWWYQYQNGSYPKNAWKQLSYSGGMAWYAFDEAGYMRTGWFFSGGHWYYLSGANDATLGKLVTGWAEINGRWYYLEPVGNAAYPQGAMYANEKTPDGYTVDASGAWVK